eukprot:CAMPEP_0114565410 /NCGR_PEP_ID=MMETSP0114-20121206/14291_1 /TAXON_ID=31324 /ORGANISM="Goniomonas sp, Strain m" /LENGTH=47 /DNA_ID= /DNA_START= /DNA_END= /DNA_ORIENTATION=
MDTDLFETMYNNFDTDVPMMEAYEEKQVIHKDFFNKFGELFDDKDLA